MCHLQRTPRNLLQSPDRMGVDLAAGSCRALFSIAVEAPGHSARRGLQIRAFLLSGRRPAPKLWLSLRLLELVWILSVEEMCRLRVFELAETLHPRGEGGSPSPSPESALI